MIMDDWGIFANILFAIEQAIRPGAATLREQLTFWFGLFLWLEAIRVVYVGLWHNRLAESAIGTLVKGCLLWWLLYNYPQLLTGLQQYMAHWGTMLGGGRIDAARLLDPGSYLVLAWNLGGTLLDSAMAKVSIWAPVSSILVPFGYLLGWAALTLGFILQALNILMWQLELLIAGVNLLALIPTLAFRSTAWAGQGALGYLVNKSFKFFLGVGITALTFPVAERLKPAGQLSLWSTVVMAAVPWVFTILFFKVNSMASGYLSGMPQLSAGHALAALGGMVTSALGIGAGLAGGAAGVAAGAASAGRASLALPAATRGFLGAMGRNASAPLTQKLQLARNAAQAGGQYALQQHPLAARLATFAGGAQKIAASQGQRSLRSMVDMGRFVAQQHDRPGYGVRR